MQLGDLQADRYASFLIQDIWYLAEVTDLLGRAAQRSDQADDLKAFLTGRHQSYDRFKTTMLQSFNLNVRTRHGEVRGQRSIPAAGRNTSTRMNYYSFIFLFKASLIVLIYKK